MQNITEILSLAYERCGGDAGISNKTGIDRVTLWKIRTGRCKNPRPATIGKIMLGLGYVQ